MRNGRWYYTITTVVPPQENVCPEMNLLNHISKIYVYESPWLAL